MSRVVAGLISTVIMFGASAIFAQTYPVKPVRLVTGEPGGGVDFTARVIAQGLTSSLGQQVIVENRGGASGAIAAQAVSKAPPDGYTLLHYSGSLWIIPLLRENVPWDPLRDFIPITLAASSPNILVVHPSLPVKSVRDLIALAKSRPGALNYAAGSSGSTPHLAAELFKSMAGVNIVRVPYKNNAAAYGDLISGQVQMMFATSGGATPHIKSGRLRALAVTDDQPSALLPGLPTVAASGLRGFESASVYGMFAPAGTAPTMIKRLNQEIVQVLHRPDIKERFAASGVEPVGSSPEEFAGKIKSEIARLGKVIKEAGIRED
jgi:tripartite-type tricarboxylate transporter receptor subunit TctC